jgi:protein-L-isoaspartate(D-aspartate) O-methyltransferase
MTPVAQEKPNPFDVARQAMIDSQVHPMGVVNEKLLSVMGDVPREAFVPEDKQGICYCDEDIEVANGRYLMEPSVLARMIQALELKEDQVVLTIGSGIGYNAAVLSHLVSTVVAQEDHQELIAQAQSSWDALSYCNIAGVTGTLSEGVPEHAPFDAIIINGAVSEIPETIKQQLQVGGRMVALVKQAGQTIAKATLVERTQEDVFSDIVLFDAGTPYLKGFEPKNEFVF